MTAKKNRLRSVRWQLPDQRARRTPQLCGSAPQPSDSGMEYGRGRHSVDAREEIRSFNQHLNGPDRQFDFKRDQIMKACLVLTDAGSVRFQIKNYGRAQMLAIRDAWPQIKRCLDLAAKLLDQFGLTAANLNARSAIHPLADYIKHRNLDA